MEYVVSIDDRGRIIIPGEVRRRLNIKSGARIILRVRKDDIVELIPLSRLSEEVSRIFEDKFKDWREDLHEASKLLERMVK